MENEKEKTKLTKPEEKENFLKSLQEKLEEFKTVEANIIKATEENKDLIARKLLGSDADAGAQPEPVKEEDPIEYAKRALSGELNE